MAYLLDSSFSNLSLYCLSTFSSFLLAYYILSCSFCNKSTIYRFLFSTSLFIISVANFYNFFWISFTSYSVILLSAAERYCFCICKISLAVVSTTYCSFFAYIYYIRIFMYRLLNNNSCTAKYFTREASTQPQPTSRSNHNALFFEIAPYRHQERAHLLQLCWFF